MTTIILIITGTILLAQAQPQVDGGWVLKMLGQVFAGLAVLVGAAYAAYRKGASQRLTIDEPVPEVPTRRVSPPPSWHQFEGLTRRVDKVETGLEHLREAQEKRFVQILEAGAAREIRLKDSLSIKIDTTARETHQRIDDMLKEMRKGGAK